MNILNLAITIASSSVVTFLLSIFAFKYNLILIKANASSELSKSEQEKIETADKALRLINSLQDSMNERFIEQKEEIQQLRKQLSMYINQCSKCSNNQIK